MRKRIAVYDDDEGLVGVYDVQVSEKSSRPTFEDYYAEARDRAVEDGEVDRSEADSLRCREIE